MRIGIVGSGLIGGALGRVWARKGHVVSFSYSRDAKKLDALARQAGHGARSATPADAVSGSDAVLIAVPWHRLDDALSAAGSLRGRIVITCSLPMKPDDSELAIGRTTSGAEELARRANGAQVAAAFNTVPYELISSDALPGLQPPPQVVYCGDHADANGITASLIGDAGFGAILAGPLRLARYLEPFALLVAHLAYETGLGPELGYRFLSVRTDAP